jgi:hypothetical protein
MIVERVSISAKPSTTQTTESVHLIFEYPNIGLITSTDTLALTYFKTYCNKEPNTCVKIYKDVHHSNQLYTVQYYEGNKGIIMFFSPLKPYRSNLYAINIRSL